MTIQQVFNVDKTKEIFTKRLGEIIEDVIGDARVRQLFDDAGKHPDQYAGKPTGLAALDLGVITPATKSALLTAQAAVRTLIAADDAEQALRGRQTPIARNFDDDVFKYVGSDNDPDTLKRAQATWMIAEHYHGEVKPGLLSYAFHHRRRYELDNYSSEGLETLRASARDSLKDASDILFQEDHLKAANEVGALAHSVVVNERKVSPQGPGIILDTTLGYANAEIRAASDVSLSAQFWEVPTETEKFFNKLTALAAPEKNRLASRLPLHQKGRNEDARCVN